ncbi:MAG: D-alanyl-D-alanine carboxypeptidase [Ruminococcaceae bacterium]|nr:D-alanyl-D-alanine carboxypeptidase [Oscillospiraceae bacterium]
MKKYIAVTFLILFLFSLPVFGESVYTGAQAAILWDADQNTPLYNQNSTQRLPMASTTKIMTAIVALEQGEPDALVTIPEAAVGVEGSSCYLQQGEQLTLRSLIYALLLQSANDAAETIALYIAGGIEEFALLMNLKANELGLHNTHFDNPHGLDSKTHYTTAEDLAKLADYCMQNPTFCEIWSTTSIQLPLSQKENCAVLRNLYNHNRLLRTYSNCVGGKTGYTMRCGRCLVTAAQKDGHTLIAVTLNDRSDWSDHVRLYEYGFEKINQSEETAPWKKSAYKNMSPTAG